MNMHMLMHAILHATAAGVIGFFVLFAASKASGIVKLVGTLLGWWLWILAVLAIVCVFVCPVDKMGGGWAMHHGWMHMGGPPPAAAPAAPAAPPAANPPKTP